MRSGMNSPVALPLCLEPLTLWIVLAPFGPPVRNAEPRPEGGGFGRKVGPPRPNFGPTRPDRPVRLRLCELRTGQARRSARITRSSGGPSRTPDGHDRCSGGPGRSWKGAADGRTAPSEPLACLSELRTGRPEVRTGVLKFGRCPPNLGRAGTEGGASRGRVALPNRPGSPKFGRATRREAEPGRISDRRSLRVAGAEQGTEDRLANGQAQG